MPKLFLHIHDGGEFIEDLEGMTYPDVEAARAEAVDAAREMLAEKVRQGIEIDGQWIDICDEEGRSLASVRFRDQMKLKDEA